MNTFKLHLSKIASFLVFGVMNVCYAGHGGGGTINVTSSFDAGNVAVIVTNSNILQAAIPDNLLDIVPGTQLIFHPTSPGPQTVYQVTRNSGMSLQPVGGGAVALPLDAPGSSAPPDDAYSPFPLSGSATITYFGTTYHGIFVTSDGMVTLGKGDGRTLNRTYDRLVYGAPAIAPLLTDLSPFSSAPDAVYSCKGVVTAEQLSDRVIVTWNGVVSFNRSVDPAYSDPNTGNACNNPTVPTNTFQVVIYLDNSSTPGNIEMNYGVLDAALIGGASNANQEGVIGLTSGFGQTPFNRVDMSQIAGSFTTGAIFEEFTRQRAEAVDFVQLAKEFYKTHPDKFNFLVFGRNFPAVGINAPFGASHSTTGLGFATVVNDDTALYGSAGKLQNVLGSIGNLNTYVDFDFDGMINPKIVKNACFNVDPNKAVPSTDQLLAFLCLPNFGNKMNETPYGFVDDTGGKFSHDLRLLGFITEDQSTDPLKLIIGPDYSYGSRMQGLASGVIGNYNSSLAAGDRQIDPWTEISLNFNFFYNNRVPTGQFDDGITRVGSTGEAGAAILQIDKSTGKKPSIYDVDNPSRKIEDPTGKIAAAIATCSQFGYSTFMTERNVLADGYSETEQYILGLRNPENVGDTFAVGRAYSPIIMANNAPLRLDSFQSFPSGFRRFEPQDDLTYCGIRRNINVVRDMIQNPTSAVDNSIYNNVLLAPTAKRAPAIGDEQDTYANGSPISGGQNVGLCNRANVGANGRDQAKCVDVKTMAFILLVKPNTPLKQKEIDLVDTFREAWDFYGNGPAVAGIGARGCQEGYSGVHNQCYDPFAGHLVPVKNKKATPDYIPKFDTTLNPKIF